MVHLKVEGLSVSYGHGVVLDQVSLEVASGTTTAILGASGCGKTTLLRAIAGFVRPSSGVVRLGDHVVSGPKTWVKPERRQIGYVSQDGNLFPHLSVADNITFGLSWRERRARSRVVELLELVGLAPELADRSPGRLSGGQQQRVSLARALARDPKLVLLDEPFSALDVGLRVATRDAVAKALRATASTVVLVTHDQGEALSFADRVAVMRGGRFAHVADPVELYRRPADLSTATFIGDAVVLEGVIEGDRVTTALGRLSHADVDADGIADVVLRPEQIRLVNQAGAPLHAVVDDVTFLGAHAVVRLHTADGLPLRARVAAVDLPVVGDRVGIEIVGDVLTYRR